MSSFRTSWQTNSVFKYKHSCRQQILVAFACRTAWTAHPVSRHLWFSFGFLLAPSCDAPPVPKFAYLTLARGARSKYLNGETAYYSCQAGYELIGIPYIECKDSGWTKIDFSCKGTCTANIVRDREASHTPYYNKHTRTHAHWLRIGVPS